MPISNHKQREFSQQEKDIFRLGVLEGERRVQYRLVCLQKANKRLWEQLVELDEIEPLVDVRMSVEQARAVLAALIKHDAHRIGKGARVRGHAAKWLAKKIAEATEIEMDMLEKLKGQTGE